MADAGKAITAAVIGKITAASASFRWLGFEVEHAEPGFTRIALTVRPEMLNAHGTLHGGLVFMLADTAFGYAAQAYNQQAVSASAEIEFLAPALLGERLIAEAREVWKKGRNMITDVRITNPAGETVALVRGRMRFVGGPHVDAEAAP
ncbi:MAG: hydroxyphenylacetyl-CoA thioesterase PaaI [Hyphomicrobiaceae bacterium]